MAGKKVLFGGVALVATFAAGFFFGSVGFRDISLEDTRAPVPGAPEISADNEVALRGFETIREEDAPRAAAEERVNDRFSLERLTLDTSSAAPRACFEFSREVDTSGDTRYADYFEFQPRIKPVAEPVGDQVCISGFDFDKDYRATLRSGLPDAKGATLGKAETATVAFGDKPAYVGFVGNGTVLPRLEADGLGFETVNVDKLNISIHRVGERALAFKTISEGDNVAEDGYGYAWDSEDGEDVGVEVWAGELNIDAIPNESVTTVFPLGAALGNARQAAGGGIQPGAYFIKVEDAAKDDRRRYSRPARAWRWVMFTDMALSTYYGEDGIDVIVRSLKTAKPVGNTKLMLIAQNNDVLAELKTDSDGYARFPGPVTRGEGALSPKMIAAYGKDDDFAVLDLHRSSLDLSDQDIGGRYAEGPVDAFLYFERGIYRPGETAYISGMLRDKTGRAVLDRPASLELRRPNYTVADTIRIDDMVLGGFSRNYPIPASAPRGSWTAILKVDGSDETYSASFSVEDFVPQRIAVELDTDEETPVKAGERRAVDVAVRFLYGAPGSGLNVEGEARVRLDPNPFPEFSEFSFGNVETTYYDQRLNMGETVTDGEGNAALTLAIDSGLKAGGKPLRAEMVVGVAEPGGRFVRESKRIPVRVNDKYIGVRRAENKKRGRNEPAEFEIVVLDSAGMPIDDQTLEWEIIEEDYRFEWYRQNGEWRWRRDYRDVSVATGTIEVGASRPAAFSRDLDYGSYRLEVREENGKAFSSVRFYQGWYSYASGASTPDQATLTVSDQPVRPGAKTRVTLAAPYAGEAVIALATDRVHKVLRYSVSDTPRDITIETDPAWGSGVYVMATVVTPRDVVDQPIPRRAMGVAYVPFDMSDRTLDLAFETEEMIRPRQDIVLPVKVDGADAGETIMMTVAAVDEGILRLTKFESPDPEGWYYGRKALGVRIYDDYGRLLNANLAAATNFGGDQLGGEGLTVVPTKSVALFNGPVEINGDGIAEIPASVPDFNGELRLMAVAWSSAKIGSTDKALTVRDAVPAELALPRFLGPEDSSSTTLLIDNVDGKTGVYNVTLSGDGPVKLSESASFNLATGQRQDQVFPLTAGDIGIGFVALDVAGPDDFGVSRSYPIQVRAPYFPVTEVETELQASGSTYSVVPEMLDQYLAGEIEVSVSFSPLNGIDPRPLLDSLRRYPYGCTEQLTSSAFPLLYANQLGALLGDDPERELRPRVQQAINKILSRQGTDGAFGLWRPGDRYATGWVGAYVTDFLYRAKQQGYVVPDAAMDTAYQAMQQLTETERWLSVSYITRIERGSIFADKQEHLRRRAAAYAFYVLARAGRADLSDLRYFHDSFIDQIPNPLARAHIGAALALMGDRARAANAFKLAEAALGYNNAENYYQSPLRDVAGMVAIAAEVENEAMLERLTTRMDDYFGKDTYYNTQEKAFLLLAASALLQKTGDVEVAMNGTLAEDLGKTPSFTLTRAMVEEGVTFTNQSDGGLFRSVAVNGTPREAPDAEESGFKLTKQIRTLDGGAVDLSAVRQNDRLIIAVAGQPQDERLHPAVVVDMLAPGFEIETILQPSDAGERGVYRWLGNISRTKVAEARDDRFVAALDVRRSARRAGSGKFQLAYIVRAVTPGDYVLPGAVIEDMYRAGDYARTEVQRVKVEPAG